MVQCVWNTLKDEPTNSVHQQSGLGVEAIIKNALMRRSLDNVTVVLISFRSFQVESERHKDRETEKGRVARREPSNMEERKEFDLFQPSNPSNEIPPTLQKFSHKFGPTEGLFISGNANENKKRGAMIESFRSRNENKPGPLFGFKHISSTITGSKGDAGKEGSKTDRELTHTDDTTEAMTPLSVKNEKAFLKLGFKSVGRNSLTGASGTKSLRKVK